MNPITKDKRRRSSQLRAKQGKKNSYLLVSVTDVPPEILPRGEVAEFRNSVHRSICVRLLQEGNHRSFSELVSLCETHNEHRAAAKPGSALNLQTPLEEQGDKLETIRLHLSRAEEADRRGAWSEVCEQRLLLAQYFSAPVDQWLSLHFYHSCADREQGGYSRPATEARACMAELYLQQGELQEALHQAERCINQAEEGGWLDSSGQPLRVRASLTLCDIYNHLAEDQLDSAKYKEALELLHRSHNVAAEIEDKQSEGEAMYRLGVAYQRSGDHDRAKKFFSSCLQIYGTLQDTHGLAKTYKAMAKSLESEGNIDESIRCLEKMADVSQSGGVPHSLVDALLQLGNIYFTTGQHRRATDFFLHGYEVACEAADVPQLQKAQVLLGNARARCQIKEYMRDVVSAPNSITAMHRLLTRGGTGGRLRPSPDSTEPVVPETSHPGDV